MRLARGRNRLGFANFQNCFTRRDHQAQKLARRAGIAPDLSTKYVREQEWYRDRAVLEKFMQRLIEAGVPEQR